MSPQKRVRYARTVRRKPVADLRWPDGIRNRIVMPSQDKAREVAIRFQAARVDGTWRKLRKDLMRDFSGGNGVPEELTTRNLKLMEFEVPQIPPCVYFLSLAGKVVYVGQSTNLYLRILAHLSDESKLFDRVFYMHVPKKHLNRIEARLISELKPQLNVLAMK